MTVCIAAMCDGGERVVTATDGLLTFGGITADVLVPGKMMWMGDWLFLYAGEPGNIDLILENIRVARSRNGPLTRENIKPTIRSAYRQFVGDWAADAVLAPYGMSMEEFKKDGKKAFGEGRAAELGREMSAAVAAYLQDQLLVVGWGKSPISAMLYEISATRRASHFLAGASAIGSGLAGRAVHADAVGPFQI